MPTLQFHPDAERELEDAADFYDRARPGLGTDFLEEVERVTRRILAHPQSAPLARGLTRRAVVTRFPYAVLYVVITDGVRVNAVAHSRRRPFYWSDRTAESTRS